MPEDPEAKEAQWGKRMIEIRVRLWTDSIADGKGNIVPGHAWDSGVVRMDRNTAHGIAPGNPVPFNSFADLPGKIEKVLIDHGVKLHIGRRSRKYMVGGA
jgi:hypothetical protein